MKNKKSHNQTSSMAINNRALKMILKRLDTLKGNKRDIIQQSIMNGWKNVYDCKSSDVSNEPTWYQDKEVKQADDDLIAQALELQRVTKPTFYSQ